MCIRDSNESLSNCAIHSICDFIANPLAYYYIRDNADGCNTEAELEAACAALETYSRTIDDKFSISPNPSSDIINIKTSITGHLSILNTSGQEFITRQLTEPKTQLDISTLPSGIYFVRATGERTVQVGKFVKQ